jgi:calmodulin
MAEKAQIQALLNDPKALKEISDAAFKKVDTDGSGYIDQKELRALMDEASQGNFPPVDDKDLAEIYSSLDTNHDGKISVDEFTVLIKSVLEAMIQ